MNPDQQNNYWEHTPQDEPEEDVANDTTNDVSPSDRIKSAVDDTVNWVASEYVHFEKNAMWFVVFALVVLGLIATDVFLLKSWTFSLLVIVMAAAVIVYIRRPPREIQYGLSGKQGLYIGERLYNLTDFKAFGLIRDGENNSIMLIPVKRFSPGVSVFFPEEVGEKIVDILGSRLPMETLKLDMIDVLVRRLRL